MKRVFAALLLVEILVLIGALFSGLLVETAGNTLQHVLVGILTSVYNMFLHCLVMFYLIGAGKDVKRAVEENPRLQGSYLPRTRQLKQRLFPIGTFAILTILIAAFAGAYVHSELLAAGTREGTLAAGDPLPVRAVPLWWIHLALLVPALLVNVYAFVVEWRVIGENVHVITALNAEIVEEFAARPRPPAAT